MSNQYPGQPGQIPPTQVAPGNVPPPPGPPPGYPQQPQAPYGAPGGGFPPPGPPPFGAPPTGGGGGKKIGLILAIVGIVVLLIIGAAVAIILVVGGDDDDDNGSDRPKVTATVTAPTTDVTTPPTTDVTTPTDIATPPTTDAGGPPIEDAEITARAYLDSLVTGNCLAVEGLSTPEWFASEYGNQRGCKRASPNADMSQAQYDFEDPIDNGDGTATLVASITAPEVSFTGTWNLVPDSTGATWLVDFFLLA